MEPHVSVKGMLEEEANANLFLLTALALSKHKGMNQLKHDPLQENIMKQDLEDVMWLVKV